MQKGTYLYKSMAKYRIKFLVCNLILLALVLRFTFVKMPYIKEEVLGARPIDMERYVSETKTITIDELVELTRHDDTTPKGSYFKETSYWQDDLYFYDIKTENIEKTDINFSTQMNYEETVMEYQLANIWYAKAGGVNFVVIGDPYTDYTNATSLSGYLVDPSKAIISEISKTLEDGEKLVFSEYFIDCRDTEMGTSSTDWTFVKISALILLFLFAKLGIYYIKPELAPTYRQLKRYGNIKDVADEINRQVESDDVYYEGKKLVTEDFILSDDLFFKKKIVRNHMSKN